jgi:hypothetical protein
MSEGNGKAGLSYVLKDMTDAAKKMESAQERLHATRMPDFTVCPASGEAYHLAMADMATAQNEGIGAVLQWQQIQVKREMERERKADKTDEQQPEIQTRWFKARGNSAMWPVAVIAVAALLIVWLMKS